MMIKLSKKIKKGKKTIKRAVHSYSPLINKKMVTLKMSNIKREDLIHCNTEKAFNLKEPLKIGIPGSDKCYRYDSEEAKEFLLNNLRANKHVDIMKIIPPFQNQSNCWFNSWFVAFFISDKGRKFFHFFRQLMIEGKQENGRTIPKDLWDAFALLNFAIDSCLTGNQFSHKIENNNTIMDITNGLSIIASILFSNKPLEKILNWKLKGFIKGFIKTYGKVIPNRDLENFIINSKKLMENKNIYTLNTNSIIEKIYNSIPKKYKTYNSLISSTKEGGDGIIWFNSILKYLKNNSIHMYTIENAHDDYKNEIINMLMHENTTIWPEIIILHVEENSKYFFINKPITFTLKKSNFKHINIYNEPLLFETDEAKYELDSSIVGDTQSHHAVAAFTCENNQVIFDGESLHGIYLLDWKKLINSNSIWGFEKREDLYDIEYNFGVSSQYLIYYRIK